MSTLSETDMLLIDDPMERRVVTMRDAEGQAFLILENDRDRRRAILCLPPVESDDEPYPALTAAIQVIGPDRLDLTKRLVKLLGDLVRGNHWNFALTEPWRRLPLVTEVSDPVLASPPDSLSQRYTPAPLATSDESTRFAIWDKEHKAYPGQVWGRFTIPMFTHPQAEIIAFALNAIARGWKLQAVDVAGDHRTYQYDGPDDLRSN